MFAFHTFESHFSTDYMPLKYDILTELFKKTVKKTNQILIHVKDMDSPDYTGPTIWINLASNRPSYYFKPDELSDGSRHMLKQIFSRMSVKKILFNATVELPYLKSIGLPVKNQIFDILIVDKILRSRETLSKDRVDDVIKYHLEDYYDDLPSLESEKHGLVEDSVRRFVMCLNLFFPLRKRMMNTLEAKDLMAKAIAELAQFNEL